MSKKAKIEVRTAGQAFACEGVVKSGGKVLHTTRAYPYGQRSNAYAAAEQYAAEHGLVVEV